MNRHVFGAIHGDMDLGAERAPLVRTLDAELATRLHGTGEDNRTGLLLFHRNNCCLGTLVLQGHRGDLAVTGLAPRLRRRRRRIDGADITTVLTGGRHE